MALNAYQTLINQTANKRALSGEEQERLRQIAAQQGAAAASSLALQMAQQGATTQPAQQTAMPDYVAASKAKSQANQAIVNGATAGQSVQVQNAYQKALANAQPSVNVSVTNRNASSGDPVSPAVQAALGTPQPAAAQPVEMKDYTWWNWMGNNDMTTMTDEDKANWNTAMQGWKNGDYSSFNDNFQTNGNWASYVDDKGNVNGMLRYVGDGVGGYVPVNGGQLLQNGFSGDMGNYAFYGPDGSVYTADANGRLTKAGNWTMQEPYSALKDSIPYKLVKGTATDEERDKWFTQVDPSYPVRQAAANGDQEAQQQLALLAQAEAYRSGATPQNIPTQNAYQRTVEQATQQTTPTQAQPIQNKPVQTQPVQTQPTQASPNIYQQYMDQWDYPEAPQWEGSEYQQKRDDALKRAEDMRWDYDPNTDPVWQALQKQYRREGDRATQEALAQAAMRTGGLANSYAVTAASQAGDYYAAQLSDRLPQLYQDAYNRYLQEFQRQMGISDQYQGFDDREYSRFGDRLQQYNTDRNFDYGRYRDRIGDARYADETAYDRQRDAISDQRYDQQWAQQLREYADQQGWKALDWQQYLREYGDKMSQQEREWAYQQYRDAVEDNRWERQYADSKDDTMYERALRENELAYDRSWNEENRDYTRAWNEDERDYSRSWDTTKWNQALREYDDEMAQQAWDNEYKLSGRNSGGGYSGGGSGGGSKTTGGDDLGPGQYKQGGIVYRSDKTHPQGQPMSAMYEQAYNDTWDKWQRGMDYALLIAEVRELAINKTITDYEGQMILNELKKWKEQGRMIDASKGGGMGSPRTQITK